MHILDVIPAVPIPNLDAHILSYFSSESLPPGALALVPLGRRQVPAIVVQTREAETSKIEIKRSAFRMKSIVGVLSAEPAFNETQLQLLAWCAEYYFTPLSLFAKVMLPPYLASRKKPVSLARVAQIKKEHENPQKPVLCTLNDRSEEYCKAVSECLYEGRQALVLVSEINQVHTLAGMLSSFEPLVVTSELTHKNFYSAWETIRSGSTRIVIGTRAALFANFANLGLVIVDEEHNPHFKSWDMAPYYHTVSVAVKLAELSGARLILGSGSPSVVSYWRAQEGTYMLPYFPKKDAASPPIGVVDMRNELLDKNYSNFSHQMKNVLQTVVDSSSQNAILFVSRRGYESFSFCRDCGRTEQCQRCEAYLVYHAIPKQALVCHHCGFSKTPSLTCPYCNSPRLKTFGTGTQKAEAEVRTLFGYEHSVVLDGDTATSPEETEHIIRSFASGSSRICIGTQAMLNKPGMPKADFVGIVSLDNLLYLPDYKIPERIYHIVHDLCAYTNPNAVFLWQTHLPEHEIFDQVLPQDYKSFFEMEVREREHTKNPPFSHLVKLIFKDASDAKAEHAADAAAGALEKAIRALGMDIEVEGPAPAYVRRVKNQYVWHIVLKTGEGVSVAQRNELLRVAAKGAIVDIDPEHLI